MVPSHDLSVFFDRLYSELRLQWDIMVDDGKMTDYAFQHRQSRMEEIGAILRALGEGQAVLTYKQSTDQRSEIA